MNEKESAKPNATKPGDGYKTTIQYKGDVRDAIKFTVGSVSYFDDYDMLVEGFTYQSVEVLDSENAVLVPENERVVWNSEIGVYGFIGAGESEVIYKEGDAVRPSGGEADNTSSTTHIVFSEGAVNRYDNYTATIDRIKYPNLVKNVQRNSIDLGRRVGVSANVMLAGLDDRSQEVKLYEHAGDGSIPIRPLNGYVIFHGVPSTCIMFRDGDLTKFASGYKLYYEDTSTTEYIGLAPTHIRFEAFGKQIYTEVRLVALDDQGQDIEELFRGRYNG